MKYLSLLNRVHAILQSRILLALLELDRRSIYQHAFLLYYIDGRGRERERGRIHLFTGLVVSQATRSREKSRCTPCL